MSKTNEIIKYIVENIKNGNFKELQKIPSETALKIKFNVARSTARESLRALVNAGIVNVQKGKQYTVVSTKNKSIYKSMFEKFAIDDLKTKQVTQKIDEVLLKEWLNQSDFYYKNFDYYNCWVFQREYFKSDKKIIHQLTFLNKKYFSEIDASNVGKSIYEYILAQGYHPTKSKEFIFTISHHPYWNKIASEMGWNTNFIPIVTSCLLKDDEWFEFSIKIITPKEFKFDKNVILYL